MFGTKYDTSNNFYIRKATKKDVDKIMNIFESLNTNEQKFLAYNQKKQQYVKLYDLVDIAL